MDRTGPQADHGELAGIVARPPFLFPGAIMLGFALDHVRPLPFPIPGEGLSHWIGAAVAVAMVLAGLALFVAGVANFSRADTPVPSTRPTRVLVTTGIHGWTRNPIYIGMFLALGGIGLAVRSPWILILALPLAAIISEGVVAREEAYLERRFGDIYRDYKARVPRWL